MLGCVPSGRMWAAVWSMGTGAMRPMLWFSEYEASPKKVLSAFTL